MHGSWEKETRLIPTLPARLHCKHEVVTCSVGFQSFPVMQYPYVPWSKVAIWGMVISPLIGNPHNGYIKHYYKVDDHPYHRKTMGV